MKLKLPLIVLLTVASFGANAQTQRTVLLEEFTQASCGPCASQNPAYNAFINNNPGKISSIKYQTSWPGVDPMNAENKTEVATRVTYYNVSGVPNAVMDGNVINGAPSSVTQTKFNAQYAVKSPFFLTVTHTMAADYKSASVTVDIKGAQNYTGTKLRLHVVLVEKEIQFKSAPGSNGETEFFGVMRKMVCGDTGKAIKPDWQLNESMTNNFTVAIPTYIRDLSQVSFIAFIQDNKDKAVLQSAYSDPQALANDAAIDAVLNVPTIQCNDQVVPSIQLINKGSATMTSATIKSKLDNGAELTKTWTGSLTTGQKASVNLDPIVINVGAHTISANVDMVNGSPDVNVQNGMMTVSVNRMGTQAVLPYTQDFQGTAFPPTTGEYIANLDGDKGTWTRINGAGGFNDSTTAKCTKLGFYDIPAGLTDELYLPKIDLKSASGPYSLKFDLAYTTYDAEQDMLQVMVSKDCGATWTTEFEKSGRDMATAPKATATFKPKKTQWRSEGINLQAYLGNDIYVKFVGTSAFGNNLYLDNINVSNTPMNAIAKTVLNTLEINAYPNPASASLKLSVKADRSETATIAILNAMGQTVMTQQAKVIKGANTLELNTSALAAGMYILKTTIGENSGVTNISIVR